MFFMYTQFPIKIIEKYWIMIIINIAIEIKHSLIEKVIHINHTL